MSHEALISLTASKSYEKDHSAPFFSNGRHLIDAMLHGSDFRESLDMKCALWTHLTNMILSLGLSL